MAVDRGDDLDEVEVAVADDLDDAPLDGPVDDRGGGDLVEAARRARPGRDAVHVSVPDEPCHYARMPVHHLEQGRAEMAIGVIATRVHQRVDSVVAGQYSQTIGVVEQRELLVEPLQLRCAHTALVVAERMVGVEHDHAEVGEVHHGVGTGPSDVRCVPAECAGRDMSAEPRLEIDRSTRRIGSDLAVAPAEEAIGFVDEQGEHVVGFEARHREQPLVGTDGGRCKVGVGKCRAGDHQVVVAGKAGPRQAEAGRIDRLGDPLEEVGNGRVAAWLPGVGHLRQRAPVRPGLGAAVVRGVVRAALGRQRHPAARHEPQIGIEFVGLGVVDVVAGAHHEVDRQATGAGRRMGAQQVDVRRHSPRNQRLLRAVHVEQWPPAGVVREGLDPLEPHRRRGIEHMQVGEMAQRADHLAHHRAVGGRGAQLDVAHAAAVRRGKRHDGRLYPPAMNGRGGEI